MVSHMLQDTMVSGSNPFGASASFKVKGIISLLSFKV